MDYSRFDHIDTDSSDDDEQKEANTKKLSSSTTTGIQQPINPLTSSSFPNISKTIPKKQGRIQFMYEGKLIYEWEQSLEEVNIYIIPPPNVPSNLFQIEISHTHLRVGIKGSNQNFLDEHTGGPVKVKESMWTLTDGELNINLQKMNKAEIWMSALQGHAGQELDVVSHEEAKKKMLLERFQEEHPGFDFSGAEFNGSVPEARSFMGGVSRS